ncbi:probable LRR receptor-like serine/threonine-protein kinase At1g56140 isoform X2 [Vigna unguiculata]|uniref:probable LRR receptor-like serine/threonine-protein kinase At1g56140 isoform X2 n=1 Tax=Vigna unguiculata TaxID=3917 RepID=UPI001015E680|nr:probable LRR receptor-like serine/threonine-protein kinase At1g56140 isoform X2 [Vigna unguiculata]
MTLFTNTVESECFLLPQIMSRRVLQVTAQEPPSSSAALKTSASRYDPGVFFFLGGTVLLIIVLILLFIFWRRTKGPAKVTENTTLTCQQHGKYIEPSEVMKMMAPNIQPGQMEFISGNLRTISHFDFRTLKRATKNFHPRNLLGSGGFGPVYQGKLADGRLVAVKTLSLDKSQQGEKEFLAEVRMITSIQHKNLVRLLGCCTDGPQKILVYEYMKNRSLDLIIYESDQFLNWNTRFQIILGVARGLQYLHEDSHLRIVHRDIKASNILLDEKFQPRIGDFGLARFFPEDQAYLSTQFAGTLGYTAPEYAIRGELSEKADIYSFGVLVLEIISCRKNTDLTLPSEMQYLPEYAWKLYEKSMLMEIVDPRLRQHGMEEKDVMQAFHVALSCLQPHADLRPAMSEIVALLTFKVEMVTKPIRPTFVHRRRVMDDENHSWGAISSGTSTTAVASSSS